MRRLLGTSAAVFVLLMGLPTGAEEPEVEAEVDGSSTSVDEAPPVVPRFFLRRGGQRIESGLRLDGDAQGVHVARKVFPTGGEPRGMALPDHLGGGFLFYQTLAADGSPSTAFYRSDSWTGELKPLGRIPFAVRYVAAGFDRIYALGITLRAALDVHSGELLPLEPFPPLVTIDGLAFDGERRALVQGPISGVLFTGDSGLTWRRVPEATGIQADLSGSHLLVTTPEGLATISEEGEAVLLSKTSIKRDYLDLADFDRLMSGSRDAHVSREPVPRGAWGEHGIHPDRFERRWLTVLTQGVRKGSEAFALEAGDLSRLSLDRGLELAAREGVAPDHGACLGTSADDSKSALFICRDGGTHVYRLSEKGKLPLAWSASDGRRLLSYNAGGALFAGACEGAADNSGVACWVSKKKPKTIRIPANHRKARVGAWAVSDSQLWALWLEDDKEKLFAAPVHKKGKTKSWKLNADHSVAEFLKVGSVLPRATVVPEGFALWATWREKFVGVLLGDSESPSFGAVQRPLRRALLDGPRAVVWGAAGFAKQSTDGGQSFAELTLPYRSGDPELSSVTHQTGAVKMGCSEVGCSLGRLLKIGWSIPAEAVEDLPPRRRFVIPGRPRLQFACGLLDKTPPVAQGGTSSFAHFWEEKAPKIESGMEGSSVAFPEDLARIYAWGPADGPWTRSGSVQAYFVDPWNAEKVKRTANTPQLFLSSLDAQAKLGLAQRSSGFQYISFDPSGDGGLMVFRGSSTTELLLFEEGKPLERYEDAQALGLRNVVGVVRSRGDYVAAFAQGSWLQLARFSGGSIHKLGRVFLGDSGRRGVQLVRTNQGDLGLAIEGDSGLFIYPVSDEGEVGAPLVVPFGDRRPPTCATEAQGYIVDQELSVAPTMETTQGALLPINRVRSRMIVSGDKVCLEGLSGRARGLGALPRSRPSTDSLPLSVITTNADGRRLQMVCK